MEKMILIMVTSKLIKCQKVKQYYVSLKYTQRVRRLKLGRAENITYLFIESFIAYNIFCCV